MCYNSKISLRTFALTLMASFFLFYRNYKNDILIGGLTLSYALIQLNEYFLWENIVKKAGNIFWTTAIHLIILLQPLIGILLFYFFGYLTIVKSYLLPLILIFVLIILYELYIIISNINNIGLTTVSKSDGHLDWGNIKGIKPNILKTIIYYITLSILPLTMKPFGLGLFTSIYANIILIYSYLKTNSIGNTPINGQWKSVWCYLANYFGILYIIISHFIYNPKKK